MSHSSRRDFIKTTAVVGAGYFISGKAARADSDSPNEKLNVAVIGCGGKGSSDTDGVSGENIVALCDVDDERASKTYEKYPNARRYRDFRALLEKECSLDAVVVSTPDHTHAHASVMAMRLGKHVYCQKPLTHSVWEARLMRDTARLYKVATQMGNQGTSDDGFRKGVEVIQSGAIGKVTEVHVWTNRPIWAQGVERPTETPPVPGHLDWDLWQGPAPEHAYNPKYCPFSWRGWWDYGTGALGDMGCHTANLAFMALDLHAPTAIEAEIEGTVGKDSPPKSSHIKYYFPARGERGEVVMHWYDGGKKPAPELSHGKPLSGSGILMVGSEGTFFSPNDYGAEHELLPEDKFKEYKAPEPTLPRSPGHYNEWIAACKGGPRALSNFDYAGRMTEALLLGNVAMRSGQRIEWDAKKLEVTNCPAAAEYIRRQYRKGWNL